MSLATAAAVHNAFAAHPLQTEDTGTQGVGNIEIENGLSWTSSDGARLFVYQPQFSYGLGLAADLIIQPSWLASRGPSPEMTTTRGFGDTNLDAKWRFFGAAPWSLAVRFGVSLPTAQHGLGEPRGKLGQHALLVATLDAAPLTLHGNAGLSHLARSGDERTRIFQLSATAMWAVDERLIWTVDGGAQTNPDRARRSMPGYALLGAIYTLRPGLDADIGYSTSVNAAVPSRQWLVGLTYRFAP